MTNEFITSLINEAHMRIAGIDWKTIESGYEILDSIETAIENNKLLTELTTQKESILKDYQDRKKEIDLMHDKVKQNEERYYLELKRLKLMLKIYRKINLKL